ncbi:Calx-beta domain-containing protein [Nocardioides sp. SR21]|uniref:Calx-beta domain-containing protein n=1 Tax=Nocardioides sp. SR21 TaxID=2919501 RepID=UPI001FA9F68D|nr:Calx-beta domain-containing protein [Nocardioides sp. SR21]
MRTTLVILAATGLALSGTPAVAKPAKPPVVSVFDTTAGETTLAPNAKLEIRLDRRPTRPVTVTWTTAEGTAKAGSDYHAASGKVVFAAGERVKKVEVKILDDLESEQTEHFYVDYVARGAKAARKRATVALIDDDLYAYGGQLEITERWEQEANGFHTIETWTLVFRPQVTSFNQGTAWYDNGYGEWELTGSRLLEDRRPDAECRTVEKETYSGKGTFFTEPHPDTDVAGSEGNLVLQSFFPQHPGNLGQKPYLHTVVSGHTDGTSYAFDGQVCVPSEYENEERFALQEAPGKVRASGVVFDHHVLEDNSTDEHGLDTYQLDVIGELRALQAPA